MGTYSIRSPPYLMALNASFQLGPGRGRKVWAGACRSPYCYHRLGGIGQLIPLFGILWLQVGESWLYRKAPRVSV